MESSIFRLFASPWSCFRWLTERMGMLKSVLWAKIWRFSALDSIQQMPFCLIFSVQLSSPYSNMDIMPHFANLIRRWKSKSVLIKTLLNVINVLQVFSIRNLIFVSEVKFTYRHCHEFCFLRVWYWGLLLIVYCLKLGQMCLSTAVVSPYFTSGKYIYFAFYWRNSFVDSLKEYL